MPSAQLAPALHSVTLQPQARDAGITATLNDKMYDKQRLVLCDPDPDLVISSGKTGIRSRIYMYWDALVQIGRYLKSEGYAFVAITPESHKRVIKRAAKPAQSLRDVFGWSRTFDKGLLPKEVMDLLQGADALEETPNGFRSKVRFASLQHQLFAHSSFPTDAPDSVFFGPDTYRFCAQLHRVQATTGTLVDVGCGSGAGGILASEPGRQVILADVNDKALAFAQANATLAGRTDLQFVKSDVLSAIAGPLGCVICNPPYLIDAAARTYRNGSGKFGEQLACQVVKEALPKLVKGGSLLLYTGTAIVDGHDTFFETVEPVLQSSGADVRYEELDPDIFGEELGSPSYAQVERIAAVVLHVLV